MIRYNSLDSKSHHLIAHTRQRAIPDSLPAVHFTWPVSLSSFILPSTHLIVQLQIYKRARVLPLITGVPKIHSGTRSVTRQWPIDFLINLTIVINRSHPPTYARGRLFFCYTKECQFSVYTNTTALEPEWLTDWRTSMTSSEYKSIGYIFIYTQLTIYGLDGLVALDKSPKSRDIK